MDYSYDTPHTICGMDRGRMERMAALLRRDAANPKGVQFDLGTWASPADTDGGGFHLPGASLLPERYYLTQEDVPNAPKVEVSCGTAACAFGLAAISGEFKADGLTYDWMNLAAGLSTSFVSLMPAYDGEHGMTAAAHFFGISVQDAEYLFDPSCYDETPREAEGELLVADRIDALLAGLVDRDFHRESGEDEDEG